MGAGQLGWAYVLPLLAPPPLQRTPVGSFACRPSAAAVAAAGAVVGERRVGGGLSPPPLRSPLPFPLPCRHVGGAAIVVAAAAAAPTAAAAAGVAVPLSTAAVPLGTAAVPVARDAAAARAAGGQSRKRIMVLMSDTGGGTSRHVAEWVGSWRARGVAPLAMW